MSTSPRFISLDLPGLHRLTSLTTGDDTARVLYVSDSVLAAVTPPFAEGIEGDLLAEFRATLDAFLEGSEISVSETPHRKPPETMLARVDPVAAGIWDVRSVSPHPGIRALGGFWALDTFVVLTWDYRENFDGCWAEKIQQCRNAWRQLFGTIPPFCGEDLDDYLTNFLAF